MRPNRCKLLDEFCRARAEIDEGAPTDRGVRLAIGADEGDAATGKANGRGSARKVTEPAFGEGMDQGDGLARPFSLAAAKGASDPADIFGRAAAPLLAHPAPPQDKVALLFQLCLDGLAESIEVFGAGEMFMGGFRSRQSEQPFFRVVTLQAGASARGNDKLMHGPLLSIQHGEEYVARGILLGPTQVARKASTPLLGFRPL
jgi:hypothetical protein